MDIDWIHRPTAPDAGDGTLNLCFNALDRHVVRGLADQVAVRVDRWTAGRVELTFARLLEEVGAFGGVLRAFGVGPGERVLSKLPMGVDSLVAALAVARVGAVHIASGPYDDAAAPLETHRPVVVLAEGGDAGTADAVDRGGHRPRAVIWSGAAPEGHDLEWTVLMRAGRTDPAPPAEVTLSAEAFLIDGRTLTVGDALVDETGPWPLDAVATLVAGATVLLSLP